MKKGRETNRYKDRKEKTNDGGKELAKKERKKERKKE